MNARADLDPRTPSSLREVSLDDKYTATTGRIYLSGVQALVRLPLMQRLRDKAQGLDTAGFVSGYRGSPLGGLDEALWKAEAHLTRHEVRFVPGINEELAATAVWGTQQAHLLGPARHDGVFALWYGKGPGVDRSIDAFKHMNHAGTAAHGGVLLVAGDDHGAYSSTLPHQSDHVFSASMIPMLYPCNVQEYVDLGLHGWAMSRFSGCAVGFKALADTVESSASIDADPFALKIVVPDDFVMPEGGLNNRLSTETLGVQARRQEALMQDYKIYAAMAYARANRLNRITIDSPQAQLGIVASGKSYLDVLEALEELGIDEALAARVGIRLFKVSMPWPLEPEGIREFARGLDEILVVEEKRQMVEYQLKEQLYNWREDVRPRVIGKFDERGEWDVHRPHGRGEWLLSAKADFAVAQIARVIASRIERLHLETSTRDLIKARLAFLEAKDAVLQRAAATPVRPAWYCSGCPHNTSTRVPDGSLALAGIGCHVMATAIYPEFNKLTTQMGGEGAPWIGAAAFSQLPHVFANLGDGTYFHSGYLAIRAAVAANRTLPVNMTYKILYNDAVAMTGGQPVDGPTSVPMIAQQVAAEGVERIAIVSETPARWRQAANLPRQVTVHDRADMDAVQRELREVPGVSVIIYDQVCAAEKRRRRKKQELVEPAQRMVINELVCEGCGDCGAASNCTSLLPRETEFGRKRSIDQSSCNKDYSCVKGFCPSFVSVSGGTLRNGPAAPLEDLRATLQPDAIPEPPPRELDRPFNIFVTGIGGTGVITLGALVGMAAHLEGKGASVLDMTGMSQKNGAVTSHVRVASRPDALHAQRIATGEADLVLGCDLLTAGTSDAVSKMRAGRTLAIVNTHEQPTGLFAQDADWTFPAEDVRALIEESTAGQTVPLDATRLALALTGDAIFANLFMLGHAFQRGVIPVSLAALKRAIELNGVAVDANLRAFHWGRLSAHAPEKVDAAATPTRAVIVQMPESLPALVSRRAAFLRDYQNAAYARRYEEFVEKVRVAERALSPNNTLAKTVARNLFKLMAYKDEYEVARLQVHPDFRRQLEAQFSGPIRLAYHLAPPVLGARDAQGHPRKQRFGAWMGGVFHVLARLRFLRGTAFDPFGRTQERRMERALITEYTALVEDALPGLSAQNLKTAIAIAEVPQTIRGYGHVKLASVHKARAAWQALTRQAPADRQAA